jgi:integrase
VGQYKIHTLEGTKTKYLYAKNRGEVAKKLTKAIAERDSGLVFDAGNLTLGEYLDRWLGSVEGSLRPGAFRRYEEITRLHIKPPLGKTKLDRVNPLQLQGLYKAKLDSGLSPRTVQIIHATLRRSLNQAVRWTLIPRNPAEFAEPPKGAPREMKALNEEQVKILLEAARGEKLEPLYLLAVTTGMRQGELLGLKWEDIDLESGMLRVRRTVFNGDVQPPKTKKSRRNITLTDRVIEALSHHPRNGGWVFCSETGTPLSCHNLHNRSWRPLLRKAGLPQIRFHDLRHTCATLLLTKGVHPKVVQELLGHSSIAITLDTYSHVLPNMQSEAVRAMEHFIGY